MPAVLSPCPARPSTPCALLPAIADVPARTKPRCAQPCRRRTKPYASRRPRALPPPEPCIHPFDRLPWVPALDAPPSDAWDLADLSQLPDRPPAMIARRPRPDLVQTTPPRPSTPTRRPSTPRSRFVPSRVLFHNLMPVLCESPSDNAACTSSAL